MLTREDVPMNSSPGKFNSNPTGKTYLFFIAIDKYSNDVSLLYNAVRDAHAVAECLMKYYELEKDNIKMLLNDEATSEAIITVFDEYLDLITDQDNLVFYFSGHGSYDKRTKKGYWLTAESVSGKRHSFFSNDEVISFMRHLKARHVFGIVDSCFSAALFTERNANPIVSRRYNIPSRWLLTAGRIEPVSDGSMGDHSPFAKALIAQLQYLEKPYVWVSELCNKVLDGVEANTEDQLPMGQPLQNANDQGGEFVFFRKGEKPPSMTQDLDYSPKQDKTIGIRRPVETLSQGEYSLKKLKIDLEGLLAENDLKTAFTLLKENLEQGRKRNLLIQLIGRYKQNVDAQLTETKSPKNITITQNRIRRDLQEFIDDLSERDL